MAEPLSLDLRERVVEAVKGGMSRRRAAAHFRVGVSSAIRWVAQAEACGDLRPKPMGGDRRSAAIEAQADTILSLLAEEPDTTLPTNGACARTIGPRIRISRHDDASARCSASNRPDQPSAFCQFTPLSKTPSTSNAISRPAARGPPRRSVPDVASR